MNSHNYHFVAITRQSGATLIVGLIMLVLLTIIGMASMNMTTVDVKVTANAKDRQLAFVGAESALFEAGQTILNTPDALDNTITGYVGTTMKSIGINWWTDTANWNLQAVPGTNVSSEFLIETPITRKDLIDVSMGNTGPGNWFAFYPATVKASGPGQASVVLQSHYVKKLDINPVE